MFSNLFSFLFSFLESTHKIRLTTVQKIGWVAVMMTNNGWSYEESLSNDPLKRKFADLPLVTGGDTLKVIIKAIHWSNDEGDEYHQSIGRLRSTPNRARYYPLKKVSSSNRKGPDPGGVETYYRPPQQHKNVLSSHQQLPCQHLDSSSSSSLRSLSFSSSHQSSSSLSLQSDKKGSGRRSWIESILPTQLPPPLQDKEEPEPWPPMVSIGGAFKPNVFVINGELPPTDPNSSMQDEWGGYIYSPIPTQSRVASSGFGEVSEEQQSISEFEEEEEWVNSGKEMYIENFGQESYQEQSSREFPSIPEPTDVQSLVQLNITTIQLALRFAQTSVSTGMRATNSTGVGVAGALIVNGDFPKELSNSLFYRNAQYPVIMRHSTSSSKDDAALDTRGCAISIRNPFDLENALFDVPMSTGEICPFWSAATVVDFSKARQSGDLKSYLQKYPSSYEALVNSVRRAPPSYSHLSYSSKMTFEYIRLSKNRGAGGSKKSGSASFFVSDSNDKKSDSLILARFRIVPLDRALGSFTEDPGMANQWDMKHIWNFERNPDDMRPPDYLRNEYKARFKSATMNGETGFLVSDTPVTRYSFEMQWLPFSEIEKTNREVFNLAKAWKHAKWIQIGQIVITQLLSDFVTEQVRFNLSNLPPDNCISIPSAWSIHNYTSVGHTRLRAYTVANSVRSGAAPRWEPYNRILLPVLSSPDGPWVTTASPGYSGGQLGSSIPSNERAIPPTLTPAGYALIPEEARYTSIEVTCLLKARLNFSQNFLKSLVAAQAHSTNVGGGLFYGGSDNTIAGKLRSAYSRVGHLLPESPHYTVELSQPPCYGVLNFELSPLQHYIYRTFEHWLDDDYEFARARLGGLNPVQIRKYDRNSQGLYLQNALRYCEGKRIGELLNEAATNQKLFVCDYSMLQNWTVVIKDRYLAAPIVFFDIEERKSDRMDEPIRVLRPLAISLEWCYNTWFLPTVSKDTQTLEYDPRNYGWLLAKMHVATADMLVHEFGPHLTHCHLVSETFMIATYQAFSRNHPLFQLLKPHFEGLATINFLAISSLLLPGNIIDQAMSSGRIGALKMANKSYSQWTLMDSVPLKTDVHNRCVTKEELPVDYPYRDDGLKFYEILHKFIKNYIEIVYEKNDSKMTEDTALLSWWSLLSKEDPPGLGWPSLNQDGIKRISTEPPNSLIELADILTAIVWNASAQHAAVNNGQFAFGGFVPNCPGLQRRPIPKNQQEVTEHMVLDSLPQLPEAVQQIGFMSLLTTDILITGDTFVKFDNVEDDFDRLALHYGFADGTPQAECLEQFAKELHELEENITNSQKERIIRYRCAFGGSSTRFSPVVPLTVEYPFLLPSMINLSINN